MFARLGIGTKLSLAFSMLALVTVLIVLFGFLVSREATHSIQVAEAVRLPASLASARAQASLLRMQLHVGGYLVLGDPRDVEQFRAQKAEFEKNLAVLEGLAKDWGAEDAQRVEQLATDYARWVQWPQRLFNLHDNPLKNRPALRLARLELHPRRVEILKQIAALIELQRERNPTLENRRQLEDLTGFQTSFDAMATNLMAYAASGEINFKLAYGPQLAANAAQWQALIANRSSMSEKQQEHFDQIAQRRAEIGDIALQIVNVLTGEHAYEDLYLYRTEAEPQAQNLVHVLEQLTSRQQAALQDEMSRARQSLIGARLPATLGSLLAIVIAIALALVSQRHIVAPVRRLTNITEQLAAGERPRIEPEPPAGDELGRLAQLIGTRLRKEELQLLMASVSDALWSAEIGPDGIIVYCYYSPVVERITALPPEHFLEASDRWLEIVHPEDRAALTSRFDEIVAQRADRQESEYRIVRSDGETRWVRDSVRATRLANGRIALNGVISDVTARKQAEHALRESEARFRSLTELSSDWYWKQDENMRFVYLSGEVYDKAGWTAQSSIGKTREELATIHLLSCTWEEHRAALAARQPFRELEYSRIDKEGHVRYISISGAPIFDDKGVFTGYQGVGRDISERRRIEADLRARQEMLELAQKVGGAVAFDLQVTPGIPRGWSAELEALHGLAPGRFDGTHKAWKRMIHPADWPLVKEALAHAQQTGEIAWEYRVVHDGVTIRWLQTRGRVFFNDNRIPVRMVGFVLDITARQQAEEELRRMESQLRQAQRLEAMGTLAGGIAHDFNNILGAILGYGEMALRDSAGNARLRRDLTSIMAAGERGRALVERILTFSRSGVGERIPVNVQSVILESLELIAAKAPEDVRIESSLQGHRAAMLGDPTQVHQVLSNLAGNAMQAMPHGGTLSVRLSVATLETALLATTGSVPPGEYLVLQVGDTGIGIPPEIMDRIFDPFFTTKEVGVGTGLGLSLVHGIVSDVGGAIDVKSAVGEGTRFTVYLPRVGDAPIDEGSAVAPDLTRGSRQRVLVIDDEEPLVRLASENLSLLGYLPMAFTSADRALEAFRANPLHFDAVITDERMPGVTGSAVIAQIRQVRADIPLILITGYVGADLVHRARQAGADEVLKKPLLLHDLADCLARVFALDSITGADVSAERPPAQ